VHLSLAHWQAAQRFLAGDVDSRAVPRMRVDGGEFAGPADGPQFTRGAGHAAMAWALCLRRIRLLGATGVHG
jgi:hypothetical protein